MIWKQHNQFVFDGVQPSVAKLVARIKDEAAIWATAGMPDLRVALPQTWDVH
jgi:hypothetical protein